MLKWISSAAALLVVTNASAAEIDWELRYPMRQFAPLTANELEKFADPDAVRNDWAWQRDLFWSQGCSTDSAPILCAEKELGAGRLDQLAGLLKPASGGLARRFGRNKSRAWLSEALHGSGNRYSAGAIRYGATMVLNPPSRSSIKTLPAWLYLKGEGLEEKTCRWTVDGGATDPALTPCDERVRFGLKRGDQTSRIQVTIEPDGTTLTMEGQQTAIKEVVIAGIGDSYAAGEGSPTIPADVDFTMRNDRPSVARDTTNGGRWPQANAAAHWAERNCHRSLLGSQMRAVMHMAAENPKVETTFLHLACTGAEIQAGLLGAYSGAPETNGIKRKLQRPRPPRRPGGKRGPLNVDNVALVTMSQVNELVRLLCRRPDVADYQRKFRRYLSGRVKRRFESNRDTLDYKRPYFDRLRCRGGFNRKLDAVLVGIGGNDVGFSSVIADALVDAKLLSRATGLSLSPKKAAEGLPRLEQELRDLNRVLRDRLSLKQADSDGSPIIISQYPDPLHDQRGRPCATRDGLAALDVFKSTGRPRVTRSESVAIRDIFLKPLNALLQKSARENDWMLAKPLADGKTRGWCAGNIKLSATGRFNPYGNHRRWTRTPNDARVIIDYRPARGEEDRWQKESDLLSGVGAFHPTGRGAAAMAEGYREQLEKLGLYKR